MRKHPADQQLQLIEGGLPLNSSHSQLNVVIVTHIFERLYKSRIVYIDWTRNLTDKMNSSFSIFRAYQRLQFNFQQETDIRNEQFELIHTLTI